MAKNEQPETCKAWMATRNSDLTEGRGWQVIIAICSIKATAMRLAHKADVQGSDGGVEPIELIKHNGRWYGPVNIEAGTNEDKAAQAKIAIREAAETKARAAGLTEEDIAALRGR